jgi:NADPH2:quinone reductase
MTSFQALRVHQQPGSYECRLERCSLDQLTPGEVVIRVEYTSLNYKDALAVTGRGRIVRGSPRIPGIDLAGRVVESADPALLPGQPVLVTGCGIGEHLDGGLSEYARVPAAAVVPIPDGLSAIDVMTLGTAGFTAAFALRRLLDNHQNPGMGPIAVTGAPGGVGAIACLLLKNQGYTVAAITGRVAHSGDWLRGLGADEVIDRTTLEIGGSPREKPLLPGRWGGAVDTLGGPTLGWLLRSVKPYGNVTVIGLAHSPDFETTVMPFILRGVSLLGIHSVECPRPLRLELWRLLAGPWKLEGLNARIAPHIVTLAEVPQACAAMIAGKAPLGRTLVRMAG